MSNIYSTITSNYRDRARREAHEGGVCPCCGWEDMFRFQKRERRTNAANDLLRQKAKILHDAAPDEWESMLEWDAAVLRIQEKHPKLSLTECVEKLRWALSRDESDAYKE